MKASTCLVAEVPEDLANVLGDQFFDLDRRGLRLSRNHRCRGKVSYTICRKLDRRSRGTGNI